MGQWGAITASARSCGSAMATEKDFLSRFLSSSPKGTVGALSRKVARSSVGRPSKTLWGKSCWCNPWEIAEMTFLGPLTATMPREASYQLRLFRKKIRKITLVYSSDPKAYLSTALFYRIKNRYWCRLRLAYPWISFVHV